MIYQVQAAVMGILQSIHGATQGHTEVRWSLQQETRLAPPCSNLRPFGSKCTVLKTKLVSLLGLFSAQVIVPPLSLHHWYNTLRQTAQL